MPGPGASKTERRFKGILVGASPGRPSAFLTVSAKSKSIQETGQKARLRDDCECREQRQSSHCHPGCVVRNEVHRLRSAPKRVQERSNVHRSGAEGRHDGGVSGH